MLLVQVLHLASSVLRILCFFAMSCEDKVIENPLYAGMSLKALLESADLFEIPWVDLKGDEGKKRNFCFDGCFCDGLVEMR